METSTAVVLQNVQVSGWHRFSVINQEEFFKKCLEFGVIAKTTDVCLKENSPWFLNKADEFEFHTDDPSVDYVAWFCKEPDQREGIGHTDVIDMRPVLSSLTHQQKEIAVNIRVPIKMGPESTSLLYPSTNQLHYAPWHLRSGEFSAEQRDIVRIFENYIASAPRISVRLDTNECLVIDNRFMVHGRKALPPDSKRFLIRNYLNIRGRHQ